MKLETHKEVMEAFLRGEKLVHKEYGKTDTEHFLYLSDAGYICEEDGAGAKPHRVPICWRIVDPEWETLPWPPHIRTTSMKSYLPSVLALVFFLSALMYAVSFYPGIMNVSMEYELVMSLLLGGVFASAGAVVGTSFREMNNRN